MRGYYSENNFISLMYIYYLKIITYNFKVITFNFKVITF